MMWKTSADSILGWAFCLAALVSAIAGKDYAYSMTWLILAKLCWIHADIQEMGEK